MKKLIFTLAILNILHFSHSSAIEPNPIISRGKQVFTSNGKALYLVDDKFNGTSFPVKNNSWIAIQLDAGPSKVFVNWNNPVYAWSNELSPASCPNTNSFPVDYNILTSSNSTNGVDGDWVIADSIRGNIVTARGHLINFSGASWVKLEIIKGGGQLDEVEVFDASNGDEDVWFFVGTSISANTYKGTPPAQNYADLVTKNHSVYNPVMIRGGIGCISSTDFVNNLPKYLKMARNAHYWAIEMGTNDAWGGSTGNLTVFKNNLQRVIDSCKASGIQPIIARMIATEAKAAKWQVNPDYLKAIDDLTFQNQLVSGPDLYTWFIAHPSELNSDGVHPNAAGAASIQRLWAEKMDSLYGGCVVTEIVPYMQINKGELTIIANKTVNASDTVIISPQASNGGSWSWSGPNGFSSTSREIILDSIQTNEAGNYIATYTNTNSCPSRYTFKLVVKAAPVKVSSELSAEGISVFPNPAEGGKFKISFNNSSKKSQLEIFNIQGKLAYTAVLMLNESEINCSLTKGVYILKVTNGPNLQFQKLVIN